MPRAGPCLRNFKAKARIRLDFVFQAASIAAFSALPPGVAFKELHGKLRGTYQLRIAAGYRIRFKWSEDRAYAIEAGHFHDKD